MSYDIVVYTIKTAIKMIVNVRFILKYIVYLFLK